MFPLPDARSDDPLLNDAFDFSRYPIFKSAKSSTQLSSTAMPYAPRLRDLGRGGPSSAPRRAEMRWRSRNVSEPQLASSTYDMAESWFTNLASARTVDDIANLPSNDNDIRMAGADSSSSPSTAAPDTPGVCSSCDADDEDDDHLPETLIPPSTTSAHSRDALEDVPSDQKGEVDSLYSTDSADQEAHPLLLSMPIIPRIKLQRKATVRKPDPAPPLSDPTQNRTFLSPRIRDLRMPARLSSRSYGHILAGENTEAVVSGAPPAKSDSNSATTSRTSRRFGWTSWSDHRRNGPGKLACVHSVSEPTLTSPYKPNNEKEPLLKKGATDESPHSDVLLSMIEEFGSYLGPCRDDLDESGTNKPKQVPPKHRKRSLQRFSLSHSLSFSSIVHAVADSCTSLDLLLRKPKTKPRTADSSTQLESRECVVPNAHDPKSKWTPRKGQIIIKVFVPATDDIWMFRVPQDIGLADFTSRVATKLGLAVAFSGSPWDEPRYYFMTDELFKPWVKRRVRFGRNLPIVAHVIAPLPLVRLSVDEDGCEVWCYA